MTWVRLQLPRYCCLGTQLVTAASHTDPTLAPIRYRDEELYKRTLEFDDDGTPLTEEELLLAQDEPEVLQYTACAAFFVTDTLCQPWQPRLQPDEFPWCYVLVFPCKEDNPAYQKNSKGARLKQKGYRMEDVIKRLKTAGEGGSGAEPVVTNTDSVLNHQCVWLRRLVGGAAPVT